MIRAAALWGINWSYHSHSHPMVRRIRNYFIVGIAVVATRKQYSLGLSVCVYALKRWTTNFYHLLQFLDQKWICSADSIVHTHNTIAAADWNLNVSLSLYMQFAHTTPSHSASMTLDDERDTKDPQSESETHRRFSKTCLFISRGTWALGWSSEQD